MRTFLHLLYETHIYETEKKMKYLRFWYTIHREGVNLQEYSAQRNSNNFHLT